MRLFYYFKKWFFQRNTNDKRVDFVFFGLGNPGKQYFSTRHNIGFKIVDAFKHHLSEQNAISFPSAEILKGTLQPSTIVATIKPITYMNRSGDAVTAIIKRWNLKQNKFLVIVDDFNLPLGTVRIRPKGSDGGHNGLKSIIEQIGQNFPRLRVGIGPLPRNKKIIDFVLGNFSSSEEKVLKGVLEKSCEILKEFTVQNIDTVMNKYN
jgi:PTH1 family peptidyl-tRNA hydrolase